MIRGVYTIPAGIAFADSLARGVIDEIVVARDPFALADVTIHLPTRRAARTLGEAFARVMGGAGLLPQIRALGDIAEDELLFDPATDDLEIPPAIDPSRRRLLLATLVQRWAKQRRREPPGFAQSAALARHLACFLDEVQTHAADLRRLGDLVPQSLAEHWAEVRDFLLFLQEQWPSILAAEGALDPAARRNELLGRLALRYRETKPSAPVIAAGTTGSVPATAELLSVIAQLPAGAVVLPALDCELDASSWDALAPGHPQYGMKQLLAHMDVERGDVLHWPGSNRSDDRLRTLDAGGPCKPVLMDRAQPDLFEALPDRSSDVDRTIKLEHGDDRRRIQTRAAILREALRPAPTTDAWRLLADRGVEEIANGLDGISVVTAAHPGEEALAVALVLREALETPGRTAALVTPDRRLARRVAVELQRWNILIDDSAGIPLANAAPAIFVSLLAEAAADAFSPVPLLALLKHPLAAGGTRPGRFRRQARALDRFVLRGPRPDPGLAGIARAIANRHAEKEQSNLAPLLEELASWFSQVTDMLDPFARAMDAKSVTLPELIQLHLQVAERLATTDTQDGKDRLWRGDAGEAAAEFLEQLARAGADLTPIEASAYPFLLRQFAEEHAVRPAYGRHPRLAILGPLEARLQHFDLVILGSLNEGTWPASAAADPWLSRPMRETLGLESPERAIGLSAHDFATLAAIREVHLTRSLKVDGAPTVASRWLQRLEQLTKGLSLNTKLEHAEPYAPYAMLFATPDRMPIPASRPEPRPPVAKRPRQLSVTQIETWLRDPYEIYARHILGLKPLERLDAEVGPLDRGSAMHEILERFIREAGEIFPAHPAARLIGISEEVFAAHDIPQSTLALWRPRFARAAQWFVNDELRRRPTVLSSFLEIKGKIAIDAPAGAFELAARADRLDELHVGGVAIIDYKTGKPPTDSQVGMFAPQLPLEGAILERGGFEGLGALPPSELVYIRFSGGRPAGETHIVKGDARQRSAETFANLVRLVTEFDREETPYASRIAPFSKVSVGDFDHLARVSEWSLSDWEDE